MTGICKWTKHTAAALTDGAGLAVDLDALGEVLTLSRFRIETWR